MDAAKKEQDHAYQNAQGWASTIAEMVAALECDYDRLELLRDERQNLIETLADCSDDTAADGLQHEAKAALADWDKENGEERSPTRPRCTG